MIKCIQHKYNRCMPHTLRVTVGVLGVLFMVLSQAACQHAIRPDKEAATVAPAVITGTSVSVVAAGLLRGDGARIGPVMNDLKVSRIDNGELVITFSGYRMPTAQFQYVIKVLPVNATARASLLSVYFIEYLPDGMRFNVRHGNANMNVDDLKAAQFMFEVSVIK